MSIKRFIINPPKNMTEESVKETAESMFAALKGIDASAPVETPLDRPEQPQDAAESVDVVEPAVGQDDGEAEGDSGDEDDEKS